MPTRNAAFRRLKLNYNAAYEAYQSWVSAIDATVNSGEPPSQALLDGEADALHELTDARAKLLNAMAEVAAGMRRAR